MVDETSVDRYIAVLGFRGHCLYTLIVDAATGTVNCTSLVLLYKKGIVFKLLSHSVTLF